MKDKGFPKSDMVRWLHNGHEIKGQTSFSLQKSHADVFSSGNYSCVPFNQVNETKQFISTYVKNNPKDNKISKFIWDFFHSFRSRSFIYKVAKTQCMLLK